MKIGLVAILCGVMFLCFLNMGDIKKDPIVAM